MILNVLENLRYLLSTTCRLQAGGQPTTPPEMTISPEMMTGTKKGGEL